MTVSIGGVPGEQAPHVPPNNTSNNSQQSQPESSQQQQQQQQQPQQPAENAVEGEQQPEKTPEAEELPEIELAENGEPVFPVAELARLDEMINRTRWVVPVLPKGELEVLLEAAVRLTRAGLDTRSEPCQRFFRDGLTTSFHKILNDEAVNQWKFEIHRSILKNTEKLIEICVVKLPDDWFPLLDLLALALNPHARFHVYNGCRPSETVTQGTQTTSSAFARPPDARNPKGWLVDLVNHFGEMKGFEILLKRIAEGGNLTVPLIAALIRPFGNCAEVLTATTVEKYFLPIIDKIPKFVESLTDDELKKESKTEMKNDALSSIIKALKHLSLRVAVKEDLAKQLETFRLKMILRLLQISSFNGKMNALNEINKVVTNVSYHSQRDRHSPGDEEEWLTAERMADWIQQNKVLSIVLKDNLHQPQYVEKLEKILRFVIKEKALTLSDLDNIWDAQAGKHDAIVKNIHDLLAKLAWDFSAEQLDHLFKRFQESWANASKKQREKLLELIRRLAEDDKEGVMAHKVLGLLWNLAHSDDVPTDIMDLALTAHIKILDYSCSQDRDSQKTQWIDRCVEELRNDTWVLPALKQIREICMLFYEAPQNYSHTQRSPHVFYRHEVINQLQQTHKLVTLVPENLASYMEKVRKSSEGNPDLDPEEFLPDGRYNHMQQVQDRLNFLRFLLKDGQLWLCAPEAKLIWQCLAENAVFSSDREACFKWFAKLMGEEPDLDPEISRDFFENNVMKLDPALLTENGIRCFERFFRGVNVKEKKLIAKRRNYLMDDVDLIGVNYMWQVVLRSSDDIASRAIEYLKETFTNLGPQLRASQVEIHENFIKTCIERIKESHSILTKSDKENNKVEHDQNKLLQEATKIVRCLTVLCEYVAECDDNHLEERFILPHGRSCRGKHITLIVRFPAHGRQGEDFEIWSHSNESLASVRRQILNRLRASSQTTRVDLYVNGELLCPQDDRRLVSQLQIRDRTLITAKIGPVNNSTPSSPDTSSDSSTGSNQGPFDGPNIEAEKCLPGVIISRRRDLTSYFFVIADYGIENDIPELRETVMHLLNLIPSDTHVVEAVKNLCEENSKTGNKTNSPDLESLFFSQSPSQVLYNLEIVYSQLMPCNQPLAEPAFRFQNDFVKCGGIPAIINVLTNTAFLETADAVTRRSAYCVVMKMAKLLFTGIGYGQVAIVAEAIHPDNQTTGSPPTISASVHNAAVILQQALQHVPNPGPECMLRNVAVRLGQHTKEETKTHIPDLAVVKAVQKIAWSSSGGALHLAQSASNEEIHKVYEKPVNHSMDNEDEQLAKEAIEVLTVCLALCPTSLESLSKDKSWQCFIIDLLLLCNSRVIRLAAAEQFFLMATRCSQGHRPLVFFITLLFTVLMNSVKDHADSSSEYFNLLCKLLNYAFATHCPLPTAEVLLNNEIQWLKRTKDTILTAEESGVVEEALLEGHLGIAKELLLFQTPQKKFNIGSEAGGANLVREIVEDFIFPASKVVLEARNNSAEAWNKDVTAVCSTPGTMVAAFDLLVALCTGCVQNMRIVADMLINMYYPEKEQPLTDWEFIPPIGPRLQKGFVGLKNGGATCYMNSVIQQLFMIPEVKQGLLKAEGAVKDGDEDFLDGEEKMEPEQELSIEQISISEDKEVSIQDKEQERREYQTNLLRQLQYIFGHLAQSRLQFHIPVGFWKTFRLLGEPVNLREQHDALEFFNSLIDNLDEGLKTVGGEALLCKNLGGTFADQKICKDCPHRYSRETPFLALNVDIRNHQHLLESMEQFVKGDLLEGANAYYCEKCDKKVDTVKRLCIKKFPKVLAIQLKRFDYDWERECAVKFNDYFEFPREFDMEPYTVQGLAKVEGEEIEDDRDGNDSGKNIESDRPGSTKYRLVGVLVHSGQASGGHYYAYILQRCADPANNKWYKFDDGDVTECKMDDNEEMKNQCFGGEYMGEVFDHMLKRMQFRRQKRWWNAYILFYERLDVMEKKNRIDCRKFLKMPSAIERSVRKQNIKFLHNRTQFCSEFFQFMRKLVTINASQDASADSEELYMISIQLVSKFLFTTGFHTKKTVRGPANEWFDAVSILLRHSKSIRSWFAKNVLFSHQERFSEYLLECPIAEVRNAFAKIIVFLAHFSRQDGPCPPPFASPQEQPSSTATLSDYLLKMVLNLLHKEVPEHGRHLQQYFQLFLMYAGLGAPERAQLLHLEVPATFILVALDKGPGPPIKYQYAELGKLYAVVSQLVRSCEVTSKCMSSTPNTPILPNSFGEGDQPIIKVQSQVADLLFNRSSYVKKIIEDYTTADETLKLLRFCCWENPHFSRMVLSELLWQVAYSYTYELKPYLDCLLQMLLLQDSWQTHRIHNTLRGIPDEERDGLFETIQRSKNHYQKRAYQCIKFMVTLFASCPVAHQILLSNNELKRRWQWAVEWLGDELERRPYSTGATYSYNNWSPPAQSNETSNGYFLERSHSARLTLAKACELCPEEEQEELEGDVENGISPIDSPEVQQGSAHHYQPTPVYPQGQQGQSGNTSQVEQSPQDELFDVEEDVTSSTKEKAESE